MSPGLPADLEALAGVAGVQTAYRTYDGQELAVDADVVVGVLQALGLPVDGPDRCADALALARRERDERVIDPVLVHRLGDPHDATFAIRSLPEPARTWLTFTPEEGVARRARPDDVSDGTRVRLTALAREPIEPGYHEITLEGPGVEASARLVSAPRCPTPRRGWGLFMPLYALRTESDWGVGSYTGLAELGRWTTEAGGSFVGTLPLYPTFLDRPADPSPYLPVTRLGYHELYVDLDAVPELGGSPEARRIRQSAEFASVVAEARRSERVAYGPLHRLRRSILEALADSLVQSDAGRRSLEEFAAARPELLAYARFRAAGERHGRTWRAWGPEAAEGLSSAGLADPSVRYHLCGQWLADRQLRETARQAPIYGDLPVGVHPDGFDPFHQAEAFAPLAHGGAPPDPFFVEGQDWAFPPLHPRGLEAQRYAYVIDTLRVAFANAAALRVDHVMGLHRLFWIPKGFDARHGAYVTYDAEVMHALVALEAHRVGAVVVGEDLGTIEDHVRATMAREGMLRTWVLEFKTRPDDPLPEPPEQCIASWATHDVPRFAAYYRGATAGEPNVTAALAEPDPGARDERAQWRAALAADLAAKAGWNGTEPRDQSEERIALEGCLGHLAASAADLVQVDLADLWGEREQENRPGTGTEAGNWSHRAAVSLEAARADPDITALLALVDLRRELPAETKEVFVR